MFVLNDNGREDLVPLWQAFSFLWLFWMAIEAGLLFLYWIQARAAEIADLLDFSSPATLSGRLKDPSVTETQSYWDCS